jgi:hypothetical protein
MMMRAVAYRLQEIAQGGRSKATRTANQRARPDGPSSAKCAGIFMRSYPLSHLYGYFGLVRLSRLGHDVSWTKA